jgi:uncharacterized linocin/CFP29 family protein
VNHLHRELAPISSDAWSALDEEARDFLRHFLAARKLIELHGPTGRGTPALPTGRIDTVAEQDGLRVGTVRTLPMIELRVRFSLPRSVIRELELGAEDADLDPLREAARRIAAAEDGLVFDGHDDAGVRGMSAASPHDSLPIPEDYQDYPFAVAAAVSRLKHAGVGGPYGIALGPDCYQGVIETTQHGGQVVFEHLRKILGGQMVWAPTVRGAVVLSQRGGDHHLQVGQDLSLGYLAHDADEVELFLEETVGFRVDEPDAAILLRYANG